MLNLRVRNASVRSKRATFLLHVGVVLRVVFVVVFTLLFARCPCSFVISNVRAASSTRLLIVEKSFVTRIIILYIYIFIYLHSFCFVLICCFTF